MNRRFFIGDVHGQFDALMHLWDLISPSQEHEIYFVGDLIDRGSDSARVINFVREQGALCIRGNHEELLLGAFLKDEINPLAMQEWLRSGGQSTLDSYGLSREQLYEDVRWIRSLPLYIDLGNIWLVHAGLNPSLPFARQTSQEFCWIRKAFHECSVPYFPDKTIITGHTMTFIFPGVSPGELVEGAGWIDIDTGAYDPKSGWLTALDWDNQKVFQVNAFDHSERVHSYVDIVKRFNPSSLKKSKSARRHSRRIASI